MKPFKADLPSTAIISIPAIILPSEMLTPFQVPVGLGIAEDSEPPKMDDAIAISPKGV
jgi:hypothetical protein